MPNKVICEAASQIWKWKLHISIHINKPKVKVFFMHTHIWRTQNFGEKRLHSSNGIFCAQTFVCLEYTFLCLRIKPMRFRSFVHVSQFNRCFLGVFTWLCAPLCICNTYIKVHLDRPRFVCRRCNCYCLLVLTQFLFWEVFVRKFPLYSHFVVIRSSE